MNGYECNVNSLLLGVYVKINNSLETILYIIIPRLKNSILKNGSFAKFLNCN